MDDELVGSFVECSGSLEAGNITSLLSSEVSDCQASAERLSKLRT